MNEQKGTYTATAARLGLPRTTLIHKMRKLGIETRRAQWRYAIPPESAFAVNAASTAVAGAI